MQLKNPGFATSVAAILVEAGIAGNRLAFEITEGVDMEMHSDVLRCLNDLKTLGINICWTISEPVLPAFHGCA